MSENSMDLVEKALEEASKLLAIEVSEGSSSEVDRALCLIESASFKLFNLFSINAKSSEPKPAKCISEHEAEIASVKVLEELKQNDALIGTIFHLQSLFANPMIGFDCVLFSNETMNLSYDEFLKLIGIYTDESVKEFTLFTNIVEENSEELTGFIAEVILVSPVQKTEDDGTVWTPSYSDWIHVLDIADLESKALSWVRDKRAELVKADSE